MLVVLDINAASSIKYGVQTCGTPEGFLSIMEMHPTDDTFCFADSRSKRAFDLFKTFCDEMCFTSSDYYDELRCFKDYDPYDFHLAMQAEEEFIKEILEDEYYNDLLDDYYATLRDAMPNCFD